MTHIVSNAPLRADRSEVDRGLSLLFETGDVVEVRIPNCGRLHTVSGYFDDPQKLADALLRADQRYSPVGVYYTLNPVKPSLLARACNRLQEHARVTTADSDILLRRWLPVDLDPVRPVGISSSAEEHTATHARAAAMADELATEPWGRPLIADSGNGAHLLFRIDLPNDERSLRIVGGALSRLCGRYSDAAVRVDVTCANAARIWKAYGTVARKGDPIPSRPHRLSRILEVPCTQ